MADIRYVVVDYAEDGYWQVGNTAYYIELDYFQDGYVLQGVTQSGEVVVDLTSTLLSVPLRSRPAESVVSASANLTSQSLRQRPATSNISASLTVTASADRIRNTSTNFTVTANLTCLARKDCLGNATMSGYLIAYSFAGVIKPADVNVEAFNTVVTVTSRIRSNPVDCVATTVFTASADRIRNVATNTPEYYLDQHLPISGRRLDTGTTLSLLNYQPIQGDDSGATGFNGGTTFSFYAIADSLESATLFSIPNASTTDPLYSGLVVGIGNNSLSLGSFNFNTGVDTTELHHYTFVIGAWNYPKANTSDRLFLVTLYVDGVEVGTQTAPGTTANPFYTEPYAYLTVGYRERTVNLGYPGGPTNYVTYQDQYFHGTIAQLWIGATWPEYTSSQRTYLRNLTTATYASFGSDGLKDGYLSIGGFAGPIYYNEFSSSTGNLDTRISYPLLGNFNLTSSADNIKNVEANLIAESTLVVNGNYAKFGDVTISSQFSLDATPYDFTKASATLDSQADLTLQPGNALRSAQASFQSAMSAVLVAQPTLAGDIDLHSEFTLTSDATTAQLGRGQLDSEFTFAAQSYEFTKATVAVTASATLTAEGRLQDRERGNLLSGMEFALTATSNRIRLGVIDLAANLTLAIQPGNALRTGNTTMSAFAFALSAGKLVDFQDENFINPSQETGILEVWAESTLLLVEAYNGLNTVLVSDGLEQTVLAVNQETNVLLAQFNTTNN